jgi:hypothetical protein
MGSEDVQIPGARCSSWSPLPLDPSIALIDVVHDLTTDSNPRETAFPPRSDCAITDAVPGGESGP